MNAQLFQHRLLKRSPRESQCNHKDAFKRDAGDSESEGSETMEAEVGVRPLL